MWFVVLVAWNVLKIGLSSGAEPDPKHGSRRRLCDGYRRRRRQVKSFWIVAGLVVMIEPVLPVLVGVTLFTTFLSFMYLDEAGPNS
ncbi:MAG: hypothetical protein SV765_02235 [Pseudomonadota bacterium]|nr:hypothetical protein [Pseudomonadales bacterium]MDY6919012.1 hypothetical protein [Pseudomonadota bacterium]